MFALLFGGAEILLILGIFALPLAVLAFVFWIGMLVHVIQNPGLSDTEKLIWVLVIIFTHFLGALIYFFVGRPKQIAVAATPPTGGLFEVAVVAS
jgi:hypothetical protein